MRHDCPRCKERARKLRKELFDIKLLVNNRLRAIEAGLAELDVE